MARADRSQKPTVEAMVDEVMCLCGCVATLNHCPHRDCATVAEVRPIIEKEIAAGKDETAILQDLAIRYGVQVLASPPAKGFTLTAWILPGVGLLAGLSFVVMIVRRWRKPSPVAATINVSCSASTRSKRARSFWRARLRSAAPSKVDGSCCQLCASALTT